MSEHYDHGPLDTYEVIWKSGHVERVEAHQVLWPNSIDLFNHSPKREHVMIHGEIDGRWKLILAAPVEDVLSVRRVTADVETGESA